MNQSVRWHRFEDVPALVQAARRYVAESASDAIRNRGMFHIVLAGGSTPLALYRELVDLDTDWSRWQLWFGDERCVPRGHQDRNDRAADGAWLNRVALPAENIHRIPAELGPGEAAARYTASLEGIPEFDLVLLGLGEDGHTASLFPAREAGPGAGPDDAAIPVVDAPKPPPRRISLTARRLAQTRRLLFLVTGSAKADAVRRWSAGDDIPAARVMPATGVDVYLDAAADPRG